MVSLLEFLFHGFHINSNKFAEFQSKNEQDKISFLIANKDNPIYYGYIDEEKDSLLLPKDLNFIFGYPNNIKLYVFENGSSIGASTRMIGKSINNLQDNSKFFIQFLRIVKSPSNIQILKQIFSKSNPRNTGIFSFGDNDDDDDDYFFLNRYSNPESFDHDD